VPILQGLRSKLPSAVFVSSLIFLSFVYGLAVREYKIFPYSTFRNTFIATEELWSWAQLRRTEGLENHPHVIASSLSGGERLHRYDAARSSAGVTFAQLYQEGGFGLVLLDMNGRILHRWKIPESAYEEIAKSGWGLRRDHYEIMGAHLYENGDVLVNISHKMLARIDRCSNLSWSLPNRAHHDVTVENDGTIWVLGSDYVTQAQQVRPHFAVPYYDDTLIRLTPAGEVIEEISILDALFDGGYQALVLEGEPEFPESKTNDPTHSNDIEIVSEDFARHNGFADPGDILVSLRTADAIVLIDRESKAAKWALTGPFLRQHDPDLLPDGTISIFDNRTDKGQHNEAVHLTEPQSFGYSRILRFDPQTQEVVWKFEGSRENPFYTSVQGDHQILENGNVLIVETEAGRIFELDPTDNSIVWEWFNGLDLDQSGNFVGRITRATRYDQNYPQFLALGCPQ
jgi:hypothetical protein